jgi:imidazolonepropionase-like amidohydrolase
MSSEKVLKKGILLINDGKVVSIGKSVKIPEGTTTLDLSGKIIYPSFIDIYSDLELKNQKEIFRGDEDLSMMQKEKGIIGMTILDQKPPHILFLSLTQKNPKNT